MVKDFNDKDLQEIVNLLGQYFDGLYEGDTDKFEKVFHESAHLYSSDGTKVDDWQRSFYFEMIWSVLKTHITLPRKLIKFVF